MSTSSLGISIDARLCMEAAEPWGPGAGGHAGAREMVRASGPGQYLRTSRARITSELPTAMSGYGLMSPTHLRAA
jgi:hypothetical protein